MWYGWLDGARLQLELCSKTMSSNRHEQQKVKSSEKGITMRMVKSWNRLPQC